MTNSNPCSQNAAIIPRNSLRWERQPWQIQLSQAIRDPAELLQRLELDKNLFNGYLDAHKTFPLCVTESYLNRIEKGNPDDPLLWQMMPRAEEMLVTPGFVHDPVDDQTAQKIPGLLHKYHGRVLLTLTGACAVHCRYCFRRHFDYAASNPGKTYWQQCLQYIRHHQSIEEVIFSGGDPLSLTDQRLQDLTEELEQIPHVKTLRIHTRQPIALPDRIDSGLLNWIAQSRFRIIFVLHTNHSQEINQEVSEALVKLRQHQVTLLNQSVLLKKVNDSVETLCQLSQKLFEHGVLPYYLHMLDRVEGAAHFLVPEEEALNLHRGIQQKLSGYLVPKLVREIPGQPHKTLLA